MLCCVSIWNYLQTNGRQQNSWNKGLTWLQTEYVWAVSISPFVGLTSPGPFLLLSSLGKGNFFFFFFKYCASLGKNNLKRFKFTTLLTFRSNISCPKLRKLIKNLIILSYLAESMWETILCHHQSEEITDLAWYFMLLEIRFFFQRTISFVGLRYCILKIVFHKLAWSIALLFN